MERPSESDNRSFATTAMQLRLPAEQISTALKSFPYRDRQEFLKKLKIPLLNFNKSFLPITIFFISGPGFGDRNNGDYMAIPTGENNNNIEATGSDVRLINASQNSMSNSADPKFSKAWL